MPESAKAAAAYANYEALGETRSLPKLLAWYQEQAEKQLKATEGDKPAIYIPHLSVLKEWSSKYSWQERTHQFDEAQREEKRRKRVAELDRMDEEHAVMGRTASIRAADLLRQRMEKNDIGAYALVQLLKVGTDLERLARGGATERSEVTGPNGEPLAGVQVVFYLPKLEHEEGYNG